MSGGLMSGGLILYYRVGKMSFEHFAVIIKTLLTIKPL